ncbi:MAG: SUMF1/EgtB/PvdO family nonheme iron enzyme [Desulfuromonadales bacterium]
MSRLLITMLAVTILNVMFPIHDCFADITWQQTSLPSGGSNVYSLAIDPSDPQTIYAGTIGGGVFKSTNGGTNWSAVSTGLTNTNVNSLAIDPSTPQTIYAGTSGGVFKSTSGGTSWSAVNTGLPNASVRSLAVDPSTPQIIYAGTNNGVFKSTNGGTSWSAAYTTALPFSIAISFAIDPSTPQTIYAGMNDGTMNAYGSVYKSMNGGASWSEVSTGLPKRAAYCLAIDPSAPQTIYAGTWLAGIFKSTDGGATWSAINTGIPTNSASYFGSLAIDPSTPQTIYAGTWVGVFKSTNGGTSWSALNTGLTNTNVYSLVIDPSTPQIVYAGTYGGGVFKTIPVSSAPFSLTVSKTGSGSGTITSSPTGISCGATCSASYTSGTSVTLTATPYSGSSFAGWSDACSGTGTCSVTMDTAKNVIATFNNQSVNGACGTSSGLTFAIAPTANLCAAGTASVLSGSGPWSWTCSGSGGGTTASCQANAQTATGKKALLIVRDYNEQLLYRSYFEAEAATISGYLAEIGLTTNIVYGFAIPLSTMQNYDLVLFDDMGWAENMPAALISDLISYHKSGGPLYFIGDDLAYNYSGGGGTYNNNDYFNLIGLEPSSDNGTASANTVISPASTLYSWMGGRFGAVAPFYYHKDPDQTNAKSFATPLMTYNGHDAFVIYQDSYGKVATQNYNIYASDQIISDPVGLAEIGRMFKKASSWLMTPVTPAVTWRHLTDGTIYGMTTDGNAITGGAQFWQESNPAWSIVGQGDFDGDGIKDFVWQNSTTGQVYIMLMSGPTKAKSGAVIYTESNTSWKIVATGDINGDGITDLIWWNKSTGQVYVMLINGTTIAGGNIIYTEPNTNWKIVAAADFNGNGKAELLWWNSTTGQVAIGQTNGTSASTANVIYTESNTDWRIAGAGDLDGNGIADIIWHNKTTGQVYGMQTNGLSVTGGAMMYTEPNTNWEIVSVGNYNSDNKAELLWWNQLTGQLYLMPMNGLDVGSGGSLLYTEPDTTWHIQGETEWRDNLYGKGVTTTTTALTSATMTDPTTGMVLVKVTGGTYTMGDTFGDGRSDEQPQHQVTLSDFYIGRYEVTQEEWQAVMGYNPSYFTSCGASCPVEMVSWNDIQTFITTLNQRSGKNYRLPTEAEWEYAARSGGKSEKYSGSSDVNAVAWYYSNSSNTTHPVGLKQPNGLGLYDMSGNVWEWVSDWYGAYSSTAQTNPTGPTPGSNRVLRGGSWYDGATGGRASYRGGTDPSLRSRSVGFRLAAPVP